MAWLAPRPSRFTPAKEPRYPLYRRLGGPQGRSGRLRKISPPPGFDPPTVQPVASRYTDYAIPGHIYSTFQGSRARATFGSSILVAKYLSTSTKIYSVLSNVR
jgi:hypothetical protein